MLTPQHVIKITKAFVDPTRFRLLQAIAKVRTGSLEGAITIPRGFLEFRVAEHLPQTDTDIVVYCASGARSLLAAQVLRTMGYTRVASMAGGITRWKEAGYPVVRDRLRIPVIPATQSSAKRFLATFGDSRKRSTVCSVWTPRQGSRAPAASDRLLPCTTLVRTVWPSRIPQCSLETREVRRKSHLWWCVWLRGRGMDL